MKNITLLAGMLLLSLHGISQSDLSGFNQKLADSLGADEYGMKSYVFVILKTGPNKTDDKQLLDSLFRGHLNNIMRLASLNKLTVAGPFMKNDKSYRGLFIFNVKTVEEANELLATDPTIQAKVLEAELYPWYGPAALPVFHETQLKMQKTKF